MSHPTTQNGPARRRHFDATEVEHDAVLLRMLGTELEEVEAALPFPPPPRLPSILANVPRVLHTPSAGMPAVDATIPARAA